MRLYYCFYYIKAEPRAVFISRAGFIHLVKSFKNIRQLGGGYALAGICNCENKLFAVGLCLKINISAFVYKLYRIIGKVVNNLMYKGRGLP